MLSQTSKYALKAALYLARAGDGRPVPAETIAVALGAPPDYMAKTLHELARAGIVAGVRGPAGGYRLLVDPLQLTVARLVATFEEHALETTCPLGDGHCDPTSPCPAYIRWSKVRGAMWSPLADTTVGGLVAEETAAMRNAG